ncbi:hypothetical protein [Leptolyngbya sp. 7M]|uniref:hypothetical protein n=1 Tax=Leptolyngbya sp. 7M TaxID=2812896 RepID=UPI001B8B7EBF|nr:hypothetical protein [Leptolyngbya sp. 7M]QYO65645.1 hypothetical protein JVX88_02320 [Leptolyngbya sp. 7M]
MIELKSGDFLVFQVESGFGVLRVLSVEEVDEPIVHVRAYEDLFFEVDHALSAINTGKKMKTAIPHVALTQRAFESTQTSRIASKTLTEDELAAYLAWGRSAEKPVSDRSIRLLLGLR